jgi:hypothetical protein
MSYKVIPKGYFMAWITCLMPDYESKLLTALIKKGYTISGAGADIPYTQTYNNSPCTLIVFKLYNGKDDMDASVVHKDIVEIIEEEKMYVFSSVVSDLGACSWLGPNIILPVKTPPALPPSSPTTPEPNRKLN